jgi:hypothetical protein
MKMASLASPGLMEDFAESLAHQPLDAHTPLPHSFGVSLVATRNGNDQDGRTYTIVVSSKDTIGNNASCSAVVTVPHDQGQ